MDDAALTTSQRRIRAFISLYRYRTWSTTLRAIALPALQQAKAEDGLALTHTVAVVSYWLVSLRVVCEGWVKLGLQDPAVDQEITSEHVAVLQRYRNGVCHFQKDFADDRFKGLIADPETVRWVERLDKALDAYFAPHHPKPDVHLIADWARSGELP